MDINKKSKVLVIGGAGFIGSHLCEEFIRSGHENIYSLDNYSTGTTKNHIDGVSYIKGDSNQINELMPIIPDVVFHLGEYSRVEKSFDDMDKVRHSNIDGTYQVIKYCSKFRCKLIYAGSSTKFADYNDGSYQSPYAWSKVSNTDLIVNYDKWFQLNYAIVYFYNAYGGREVSTGEYATLIGIFTNQRRNGHPLTIVSPGTQLRNFTHVSDITNGLKTVGELGSGDGYGIGCDTTWSVLQVAELFGGKKQMLPERPGNRKNAKLMTTKTKELGWSATIELDEYIKTLDL